MAQKISNKWRIEFTLEDLVTGSDESTLLNAEQMAMQVEIILDDLPDWLKLRGEIVATKQEDPTDAQTS
jgi:hypothetical protein